MKGLYKVLPPFAPDYSGACSVLFELGGISVIHDASGCTGNFVGYDEPRCYGNSAAIFTSELREIDAVFGDDKRLITKIEQAVRVLDKQFVAILGSPAPMVIGTDYKAIATVLAKEINIPAFSFDTNGIDYYDKGASAALLELAHRFVKPKKAAGKKLAVNILGATPLDIGKNEQAERLISLIENSDFIVQSCWSMGSTLDDIAEAAQVNANLVVSWSGLKVARYMQTEFGIPYLVGLPVGARAGRQLINDLLNLVGLESKTETADVADFPVFNIDSNVLVIGEQVKSNSIRQCLRVDMGMKNVDVASFFSMEKEIAEGGDMHIGAEEDLGNLMDNGKYDIVIGDPLYKDLALASNKSNFIDFPHAAVSSRVYWGKEPDYIGSAGSEFFRSKILSRRILGHVSRDSTEGEDRERA